MPPGTFGDVRCFATLDSTNRYLLEEARAGAPEGVVAVADYQSAGRGRLGRRWEAAPQECLLASVLLRPALPEGLLYLCTAIVALSAADACEDVAGVRPDVKWPNDLLIGDRKLAGVLAESDRSAPGGPAGSVAVVVGIGLNIEYPGPAGAGGISLRQAVSRRVDRFELLDVLLASLEVRHRALEEPEGRAALVGELRGRCVTLGQRIRVDLGGSTVEGLARELTDEGHLVLETEQGREEVAAGDIVHLRRSEGEDPLN
jgi:BirA family biotin operon repressor/biotin-[acetyl-CoA-carboxylase] ligase